MTVRIPPIPDERARKIAQNPERYFAEARRRVRAEVEQEVAREHAERAQ